MAIKFEDQYPGRSTPGDSNYPNGSFKNSSDGVALDGTPADKVWSNDWLGFFDILLERANIIPSGTPDTVLSNDRFNALLKLFTFFSSFNEATYSTGDYTINHSVDSAVNPIAYIPGMQINVFITTTLTDTPARLRIGTLDYKNITDPDGSAIATERLRANNIYQFRYNQSEDRFEMLNPVTELPRMDFHYIQPFNTQGKFVDYDDITIWDIILDPNGIDSISGASLNPTSHIITLPKGFKYRVNIIGNIDDLAIDVVGRTRCYIAKTTTPGTPILADISDQSDLPRSSIIKGYLDFTAESLDVNIGIYAYSNNNSATPPGGPGARMGQPVNTGAGIQTSEIYMKGSIFQLR